MFSSSQLHAIIHSPHPLSISVVFKTVKVSPMMSIMRCAGPAVSFARPLPFDPLRAGFDRALGFFKKRQHISCKQ
jgi:hypothetical protein